MNTISRTLLAAAMTAPMLLGCGAQSPLGDSVPGLPADFKGPGTYTVPAVPDVQFTIASVDVAQGGGTVSIYYDLPDAFPARVSKVHLTGTADETDTVELAGPAGTSTCTLSGTLLECHEQLSGVHFDASALPANSPVNAAVESFIVDPVGVLSVVLPQ
jgi:hypothetical protein